MFLPLLAATAIDERTGEAYRYQVDPEELSHADIRCRSFQCDELTSDIVAAFVANNALRVADLSALI